MLIAFARLAALLPVLLLAGCLSGPSPQDRAGVSPALSLETYFQGRTYAYGVFERDGVLDRVLHVEIDGEWDGRALTLDEHFLYDNGDTQRRIWTMTQTAPNRFSGTAGDVIGEADISIFGDAAYFGYLVDLPLSDGSTVRVRFNDRIYRLSDDVLINRASVSKFGITVGEVTIVFLKDRPADWPEIPRG
ncbi:MAG: DUF3833 family protein [Caulobacterales bacterium]|uniref:DUF3833 family protein n=1 Tax=Glycocaulis sp. TaxID=1969725 RepID=UPI003FA16AE0